MYLMNPVTGCFLRTTPQRKLAFTSKPSPSCLFRVMQSTTAQSSWGFYAVHTQRFVGQNLMQRLVVTSKKVHAWETFQVLQRPDEPVAGEKCSPPVYLLLSAARFGKGMWVADKTSTFGRFSQSKGPQRSRNFRKLESGGDLRTNRSAGSQRGVFMSKQFDDAIGFVYSSDLAALIALAAARSGRRSVITESEATSKAFASEAPTSPRSAETLLQAKDATFHVPMLARWDRGELRLPWLDTATATANANANAQVAGVERTRSFLEIPEERMSEVMTAAIPGSTVTDFLDIVAPRSIRLKCDAERSSLIKSGSCETVAATASLTRTGSGEKKDSYDLLRDWHAHPLYGMIRALSYRADAGAVVNTQRSSAGNCKGPAKSATLSNLKAAIVEQYHSCTVDTDDDLVGDIDERVSHKAALRTKMYTRGIPYSNCFSIEVLMEVEEIPLNEDTEKGRACLVSDATLSCLPGKDIDSALQIRWRAGVIFSRHITLEAQIERGALNGVQNSCASILNLLRKHNARQRFASPIARQNSLVNADCFNKAKPTDSTSALAASGNLSSSFIRGTREKRCVQQNLVLLPQAFALEVIKGLVSVIADTNLLSDKLSTLPVQLPWRPFICVQSSVRPMSLHTAAATVTAIPFFESKPEEMVQVFDENMGSKVTAALFFEALLSDALSYFRRAHADSGTMEVDISAWRAIVPPGQPYKRTNGYIRKQVFRVPLSGIPGAEVAQVEDFQYYALVKARNQDLPAYVDSRGNNYNRSGDKRESFIESAEVSQLSAGQNMKSLPTCTEVEAKASEVKHRSLHNQRLEFGMKLFVPALPGGSLFTIEVLAIVEPAYDDSSDNSLRIFFASPLRNRHLQSREHPAVERCVLDGVSRGLRQIWKQIAQTMMEVCETDSDYIDQANQSQSSVHTHKGWSEHEMALLQRLRTNLDLPTHDELASRLIDAIAAAFRRAMDRNVHAIIY